MDSSTLQSFLFQFSLFASPRFLDMITARPLCARSLSAIKVFSFFCLDELEEEYHVIKKVIPFWMPQDHSEDYLEIRLLWLFTFYSLSYSRLLASMLTSTARIPSKYATISNVLLQTWAASNTGELYFHNYRGTFVLMFYLFLSHLFMTLVLEDNITQIL